jgi:hypothetical protein
MKLNRRKSIFIFGITLVAVVCFFILIKLFFPENTFESSMKEHLKLVNHRSPYMMDKSTRFDSAGIQQDKTVVYYYTLTDTDSAELTIDQLKISVRPILLERVKTDPAFEFLRKNNVTVGYLYRDKKGVEIIRLNFTAKEYK